MNERYHALNIDYAISQQLQRAIDDFLYHINYEDGTSEDCYRSEIHFWLKDELDHGMSFQQFEQLKEYYVLGGVFKR